MPYALTLNKTRPSRQERGKTKNRISKRLGKLFVLEQEKKTHTFPQLLCTSSNKTNYTHTNCTCQRTIRICKRAVFNRISPNQLMACF